jgi:hypothetical protein
MIDLNSLETVVNNRKPTDVEGVHYLFWDKGISLKEFNELPLPYIFGILKVHNYIQKQEEKAMKKAQRKR